MGKYTFLFITVILIGCSNVDKNIDIQIDENFRTLDLNSEVYSKSENLVKNVRYISLEGSPNPLIGDVDQIFYYKEKFYLFDRMITKSLYVFSKDGKFLYELNKFGRGPAEYNLPLGFDIDSLENIYISDNATKKILKYDSSGEFKEEFKSVAYFREFCLLSRQKILLRELYDEKGTILPLGIFEPARNRIIDVLLPRAIFDDLDVPRFGSISLFKSNNVVYFTPPFSAGIYKFSGDRITKAFGFDPELCPPSEFVNDLKTDFNVFLQNREYVVYVTNIYETSDFVSLKYQKLFPTNLLIAKKSGNTVKFLQIKDKNYLADGEFLGIADDKFISLIKPEKANEKWKKKVRESTLADEVRDQLLAFSTESNPIICLVEFNDF